MLQKNQIVPLTITAMSAEGSGIGRYAESTDERGIAIFVPFTAIGDVIRCRIVKVQKTLAFGRVEELVSPSVDRLPRVDCPAFGKCGGCTYRHMSYEAELLCKWQRVADALERIGGLSLRPEPIVACERPDRYRNKAQYPVAPGEHRPVIGLYAARSHRVIEQRDCLLQPEAFEKALDVVAQWAKKNRVPIYDETNGSGVLRHIYIREGAKSGERMVCLVCTCGKLPDTECLVAALREAVPGLSSVMVNLNAEDTNVVLGKTSYPLYGEPYITDTLCDLKFRLSPLSFYQVNHDQAERLYRLAAEAAALTGEEALLDLYCGTGTIGLSMAHRARELVGVEVVPQAVEDAARNASDNGVANARFIAADAAQAAKQLAAEGWRPDVVVLDPPRKGCEPALLRTVADMNPDRVVYVSCDPATLARDLKLFAEWGYVTERVTPVDMFPRTAHVESVARLSRRSAVHRMKLHASPFEKIKSGEKTIELRLFDEKRQQIKAGDTIVFTNTITGETLDVSVLKLHRFGSFEELYAALPLLKCGYTTEDIDTAQPSDMEQYYSVEEQKKYGVIGIEVCCSDEEHSR